MKRILIAYGTRYGSTKDVAEELKLMLEEKGSEVDLLDVKGIKESKWPSLEDYDGVIVGTSIRMMKWMNEPKRFLMNNKEALSKDDKVLGVFVSSMTAAVPEQRQDIIDKCINDKMDELGIRPHISDAFGGVFDFSSSSNMGIIDRKIAKTAAKMMVRDLGIEIKDDVKNEFRDWEQIRKFAEEFTKLLE